ncbi:hypothetical protein KEM56_000600 [Ascosphaera pollenicola]|nr:hypothetical protein KEM56_000600 [Ascosphaera pollenicola]
MLVTAEVDAADTTVNLGLARGFETSGRAFEVVGEPKAHTPNLLKARGIAPYSAHMDEEDDIGFESTSTYYGAHYDSGPPPYPDDHVASPRPARPTRDNPEDIGQPQASHRSHQREQPTNPFVSEEDDLYESQTTEPNRHGNTDAESTQYQQRPYHSSNSA